MLAGFEISNLGRLLKKYRALICCGYTVSVYTGMCHLCSQPVKNISTQQKAWNCMICDKEFHNFYKNLNRYAQTQQEEHVFSESSINALSRNSQVNPASISGEHLAGKVR